MKAVVKDESIEKKQDHHPISQVRSITDDIERESN